MANGIYSRILLMCIFCALSGFVKLGGWLFALSNIFHMGVGVGSEFIASEFILSFGMIVGQYGVWWLALLCTYLLSVHLPEQEA